jgi:hypothetical protein
VDPRPGERSAERRKPDERRVAPVNVPERLERDDAEDRGEERGQVLCVYGLLVFGLYLLHERHEVRRRASEVPSCTTIRELPKCTKTFPRSVM